MIIKKGLCNHIQRSFQSRRSLSGIPFDIKVFTPCELAPTFTFKHIRQLFKQALAQGMARLHWFLTRDKHNQDRENFTSNELNILKDIKISWILMFYGRLLTKSVYFWRCLSNFTKSSLQFSHLVLCTLKIQAKTRA